MPYCGMIPLLLAIQFIGIFPTIEGGINIQYTLLYVQKLYIILLVIVGFIGTMQNKVSIHDILENAKVMLGNSRDIQDTDSDTGEKLQGV